jgi:hypothetical protein
MRGSEALLLAMPLLGAVAGAILFLGAVALEARDDGRWLPPAFGCSPPRGYDVVNLPAQVLAAVHPVRSLAPQQCGDGEDRERTARWNAGSFFLLGLSFYSAGGLLLGSVVRVGAQLARRLPRHAG